ncbi:hypothetical protein F5Y19DRAFT_487140 [Xylariaceae sp. FL1651]|nr:hypothetical protein F5Y19DRAFT_487140 [Xylariaceae sp. FL1651]
MWIQKPGGFIFPRRYDPPFPDNWDELQPVPWQQELFVNYTFWTHDCSDHHEKWPTDGTAPTLHAYDAQTLKDRSWHIRNTSIEKPSAIKRRLRHEFLTDYRLSSFEGATIEQSYQILESWAVLIDKYFFDGALTQGPEKLITLRVNSINFESLLGFTCYSIAGDQRLISVTLRYASSGKLRPKVYILQTLIHEMCHAYCSLFYNFCPVLGMTNPEYFDNGHHGALFNVIFNNPRIVMCFWGPELEILARYVTFSPPFGFSICELHYKGDWLDYLISTQYIPAARKFSWIRAEWEASDHEYDQVGLVRWRRQGVRSAEFKRALLRLNYETYDAFVGSRVPYPTTIKKAIFGLSVVVFLLILYCLWWSGVLGANPWLYWYIVDVITYLWQTNPL